MPHREQMNLAERDPLSSELWSRIRRAFQPQFGPPSTHAAPPTQTDDEYLRELAAAVREHGLCDHADRLELIASTLANKRQYTLERDRRLAELAFRVGRLHERHHNEAEHS